MLELECENHSRDAAFSHVLHGASAKSRGGVAAMLHKDNNASKVAVDGYFKHWDGKSSVVGRLKPQSVRFYVVGCPSSHKAASDGICRPTLPTMRLEQDCGSK